jgi:hypothetical protein
LRKKAALSFPEVSSDCAWALHVGQLVDKVPFEPAFVVGDSDAESDSSWRELFKCALKQRLEPVIFVHPVLDGHENRDVDRKRSAAILQPNAAELKAAVSVLSTARPAKHGKGMDGASKRSGKQVEQLQVDARVIRLAEAVKALVDKSKSAEYLDLRTGEPSFILTDGKWMRPVFSDCSGKRVLVTSGFYSEMSIESIDASFLTEDGTLVKEALWFACRCCPPVMPSQKSSVTAVATWQKWAVAMQSSNGKNHSAMTMSGGVCLKSFQSMVKYHMETKHGGGTATTVAKWQQTAEHFALGAALLQTPEAQAGLQAARTARTQQTEQGPPPLTPADPPEPPPIMLCYPFDAPAGSKERDAVQIRMVDISTAKLAAGSKVSWRVYDLLRRYEFQCALNMGLPSEQVLIMPPSDSQLILLRMVNFQETTHPTWVTLEPVQVEGRLAPRITISPDCSSIVVDQLQRGGSLFATFQLLNMLQEKVSLMSPRSSRIIPHALQLVAIPVLSDVHNSEFIWLPHFNVAFSFDSYPSLHTKEVGLIHMFVQHVACSAVELIRPAVPHQPRDGNDKNVCAFSATLFLRLALKCLKQHGPTPALVDALRELSVEESDYHKCRKQAAKDINSLAREYGRIQQEARIQQRKKAKAAGQPGPSSE